MLVIYKFSHEMCSYNRSDVYYNCVKICVCEEKLMVAIKFRNI